MRLAEDDLGATPAHRVVDPYVVRVPARVIDGNGAPAAVRRQTGTSVEPHLAYGSRLPAIAIEPHEAGLLHRFGRGHEHAGLGDREGPEVGPSICIQPREDRHGL